MTRLALLFLFMAIAAALDPETQALCDFATQLHPFTWSEAPFHPCNFSSPCEHPLAGVQCTDGHITELNLFTDGMEGELPESLLNLKYLEILDLSENRISGDLFDLSNMTNLKLLDFSKTLINGGEIPSWICTLKNLEQIGLAATQRTGEIPTCLYDIENLRSVDLANNKLTGDYSNFFYNVKNLRSLDISNNYFDSLSVADYLCNSTAFDLTHLKLSNLNIVGNLHNCNDTTLTNLFTLDLSINNINSELPIDFLAQLKSLKVLNIGTNSFYLDVTSDLSFIEKCDVSFNNLNCVYAGCSCYGQFNSYYDPKYSSGSNAVIITFCVLSAFCFISVTSFFAYRIYKRSKETEYHSIE